MRFETEVLVHDDIDGEITVRESSVPLYAKRGWHAKDETPPAAADGDQTAGGEGGASGAQTAGQAPGDGSAAGDNADASASGEAPVHGLHQEDHQ